MLRAFPLLAASVLIYNLTLFTRGGINSGDANTLLSSSLFTIQMNSGARWLVSLGDLFLAISLVLLFIEILKATTRRKSAIVNHSLSMILFVVCLVEFLLLRGFATSIFFLITLTVLLDVLAGFIVTIAASRREIDVNS